MSSRTEIREADGDIVHVRLAKADPRFPYIVDFDVTVAGMKQLFVIEASIGTVGGDGVVTALLRGSDGGFIKRGGKLATIDISGSVRITRRTVPLFVVAPSDADQHPARGYGPERPAA